MHWLSKVCLISLVTAQQPEHCETALANLRVTHAKIQGETEQLWASYEASKQNERSAMAALTIEMSRPVILGDFDRVGFVRLKKVGSTAMEHFLLDSMIYQDCVLNRCLYSTGRKLLSCPPGQADPFKQCLHEKPIHLDERFANEKDVWLAQPQMRQAGLLPTIARSQLYKVVVLREPVLRTLSDFYFAIQGGWVEDGFAIWKQWYPEAWKAIVEKNFTKYVITPSDNLNDMTLQLARSNKKFADLAALEQALIELRKCKLVLLAEYMPQGLLMLEHVFGVRATNQEIYTKKVRISKKDNSRSAIEKDDGLMELARKGCWADQILYEEAKKIFFSVFTRFLQSRGDPVTNVTEALARYELGPLSPANLQYQASLMPLSSSVSPVIPDRVPKVE
jgi:hypothetical protein